MISQILNNMIPFPFVVPADAAPDADLDGGTWPSPVCLTQRESGPVLCTLATEIEGLGYA